jgi:sugar phosphate isomerase/epimerase
MKRKFAVAYLTAAPLDPPESLLLAHKLGYSAIGIRLALMVPGGHFSPLAENANLLRETLVRSQDTDVAIFDVEGVRLDGRFRRGSFDRQMGVAAELGAKVVTVIGDDPDEQRLIDSFAQLCDTAASYHLVVSMEFMPYSTVPDANSALRILRRAGCSNGRIVIDFLHARRSRMTAADLAAIPRDSMSHAQLCDAPAEIPTDREALIRTARCARLLPGEGGIDVRAMVSALPADLPLSVETPNSERLAQVGPEEWLRRSLKATQDALAD